jgi:hypothetical protein
LGKNDPKWRILRHKTRLKVQKMPKMARFGNAESISYLRGLADEEPAGIGAVVAAFASDPAGA